MTAIQRKQNNLYIYSGSAFPPVPERSNSLDNFATWPYCIFTAGTLLQNPPSGCNETYANNTMVLILMTVYKINLCVPLFESNSLYKPDGTFSVNCGNQNYAFEEWQKIGQDRRSTISSLPSMDTVISWAKHSLGMQAF